MKKESKAITIDATGQSLGRLATRVARLLQQKHLVSHRANVAPLQHVHVVHCSKLKIDKRKFTQKLYYSTSGYPGALRATPMGIVFAKNPGDVFTRTVRGMLPKSKLRSIMLKNLHVENA